jgi:hypothetical protein
MAPLVIIRPDQSSGDIFVARRARLRDRLMARFATRRLDSELARGVAPDARVALALRAHALGEPGMRKTLACSLRTVLSDARAPQCQRVAKVPTARSEVLDTAEALSELAERLIAPGPLAARGLARVRLLLSDGSSPLYWRHASDNLHAVVARALDELEPAFQW